MISFWEGIHNKEQRFWKYLFFIGVGLGLLAKGPIIIILTGPPIFIWLILSKEFKNLWKSFPWIIGVIITALVAVPWYYFAEQKSPGFIDYFIVGEHFKRFLSSGWQGDKYGFPKSQPFGIIWIFLMVFAIPWIVIAIKKLWQNKPEIFKNKWVLYLFLWLVWTPLFFTISKSLIHPYIMPIMVPIALLITHWWKGLINKNKIIFGSLLFPTIAFLLLIGLTISGKKEFYMNSDKYLIENTSEKNLQIYHWQKKSYSGQFYTQGTIKAVKDTLELNKLISENKPFLMIIPHKKIKKMDEKDMILLKEVETNYKKSIYLFKD